MKGTNISYRFEMPDARTMEPVRKIAGTTSDLIRTHPSTCYLHIRDWQRYRGLTIKEACQLIGTTEMSYRNWHDNRHWPNSIWLPHLAKAFGCSIEELFFPPPGMRQ